MNGRRKAFALLASTAVLSTATIMAAPTAAAETNWDTYYKQKVEWAPCATDSASTLECATILVPMNYRKPAEGNLGIAISRLKASDAKKRQGVLLLNPGGPGGPGLDLPMEFTENAIAQSFDLIGFDPRGVGRSAPLDCEVAKGEDLLINRPTDNEIDAIAKRAQERELGCQKAAGGLRPHISTANTARDMDIIRGALGELKINYLGYSYGTYLGAVYGGLFPGNLNRNVLDSSVHPDWVWQEQFKQQAVGAKENFDAWVGWTAERDKTYHLGTTVEKVTATLDAIGAKIAKNPITVNNPPPGLPRPLIVSRNRLDQWLGSITRSRPLWDIFGTLVGQIKDAVDKAADTAPEVSDDAGKALGVLAGLAIAETESGVFQTVTCEADWSPNLSTYKESMQLYRDKYPYGRGAMAAAPTECSFRSFTPPEPLVKLQRKGYPVGIVVQAENDTQTQYDGGPAMAAKLGDNLVSVRDEGAHAIYGRNACVTKKIDDYLINGVLPGSRTTCDGAPRPNIAADQDAKASPQAKPAETSLEKQVKEIIATNKLDRKF